MLVRAEWRSATVRPGAQSVMTSGTMWMREWLVHSLDTHPLVSAYIIYNAKVPGIIRVLLLGHKSN